MKSVKRMAAMCIALVMVFTLTAQAFAFLPDYYTGAEFTPLLPRHVFSPVTGEVVSVTDHEFRIQVRLAVDESYVDFNLTGNTFLHGDIPEVGDTVTGFFDANSIMIMIYPPQYEAVVMINQPEDLPFAFVGRFFSTELYNGGTELISADNNLRLNPRHPETVIISQGGQDATDWELDGRMLVVFYTVATRSMPPLVNAPEKIVVMYEIAVHPGPAWIDEWEWNYDDGYTLDDGFGWDDDGYFFGILPPIGDISYWDVNWDDTPASYEFYNIVLNGVGLPNETFYSIDGVFPTHVPLRAIAEAYGIEVGWQRPYVTLNGAWGNIAFEADSNIVYVNGNAVVLSSPAIVVNGRTQVPIDFFRVVVGFNNAWSAGGTVFIDNFERME